MSFLYAMAQGAVADSQRWFPNTSDNPFFSAACMAGEVGEVLNLLKKIERGSHSWTPEMQKDVEGEVADVFTYLLKLAGELNIDLLVAYREKQQINETRFTARKSLEAPDALEQRTMIIPRMAEGFPE